MVQELRKLESFIVFDPAMISKKISLNELECIFGFLSPLIFILHGSTISRKKYSQKIGSDLDLICVTSKAAFWSLGKLHHKVRQNLSKQKIKFDVTIITSNECLSLIDSQSSLKKSLDHGFTIIDR